MFNIFGVLSVTNGSIITAIFAVVLVALVMLGVWGLTRVGDLPKANGQVAVRFGRLDIKWALFFVVSLGIIVRIVFAILIDGNVGNMQSLLGSYDSFDTNGLKGFYGGNSFSLYPVTFVVNGIFGSLGSMFDDEMALSFFIRLPLILADIGSVIVLYAIAKKYINVQTATIVAALFILNPLFIFGSSIASQVNSLVIFTLLLTFYFLVNRRIVWSFIFFGISLLIDPFAQLIASPMLVYAIYLFVKAWVTIKKEGIQGMRQDYNRNPLIVVPLAIICVFVGMWLVSLPLVFDKIGANPFVFLNELFIKRLHMYSFFGRNSLSLYSLFGRNADALTYNFSGWFFGITFFLLSACVSILLFLSKRNRANMVLISCLIVFTISAYFVDFDAYTLVPFVGLLLMSFVFIKDRRLLKVFGLVSLVCLINGVAGLSTSAMLNTGFGMVINIAMSVVAILTHIYFTVVVLDICMSNRRLQLETNAIATFGNANKNWLKIRARTKQQ